MWLDYDWSYKQNTVQTLKTQGLRVSADSKLNFLSTNAAKRLSTLKQFAGCFSSSKLKHSNSNLPINDPIILPFSSSFNYKIYHTKLMKSELQCSIILIIQILTVPIVFSFHIQSSRKTKTYVITIRNHCQIWLGFLLMISREKKQSIHLNSFDIINEIWRFLLFWLGNPRKSANIKKIHT